MVKETDIKAGAIFEKRKDGILVQEYAVIENKKELVGGKWFLSYSTNPCHIATQKMRLDEIVHLLNWMEFEPTNRMVTFG